MKKVIRMKLHWQILIGLVLGVLYGYFLAPYSPYVAWMGALFMRGLKMVIVPLIFTSISSGIINLGSGKNLGRLGAKTLSYYMLTSLLAIVTGLILVNIFQPGVGADLGFTSTVEGLSEAKKSFGSILLNIVPTNVFNSFSTGAMLSIIFFSMILGLAVTSVESKYSHLYHDLLNGGFEIMMKITGFIIKFTPVGIFGIVAKVVAEQSSRGNFGELVERLGIYMFCVLAALFIHAFISLPLLVKLIGKTSPIRHFKAVRIPLLTAFSTSSSSATLPLTMEAVEHEEGVSNMVTSFTLPLGATINMDGTALYECIAAMFIAQAYDVKLGIAQQIIVVLTALLASIGAAGIPMAGLVMISVILSAIGLPLEGVGLILAVDRVLDMFRTSVNVWSDSCGAIIVAKSEGEDLKID